MKETVIIETDNKFIFVTFPNGEISKSPKEDLIAYLLCANLNDFDVIFNGQKYTSF